VGVHTTASRVDTLSMGPSATRLGKRVEKNPLTLSKTILARFRTKACDTDSIGRKNSTNYRCACVCPPYSTLLPRSWLTRGSPLWVYRLRKACGLPCTVALDKPAKEKISPLWMTTKMMDYHPQTRFSIKMRVSITTSPLCRFDQNSQFAQQFCRIAPDLRCYRFKKSPLTFLERRSTDLD
jgi:hypothetical protein